MRSVRTAGIFLLVTAALVIAALPEWGEAVLGAQSGSGVEQRRPNAPSTEVTETPSGDTYISQGSPDANYGLEDFMWVARDEFGQESFALVQFSLSGIPAGSVINSASFQAYLFDGGTSSRSLSVYRITSDWGSTSVTWNTQPNTSCCWGSTTVGTSANAYYAWDVTSLVQAWVDGTYNNYGLALRNPSGASWAKGFRTLSTSNPPRLVINYTEPTQTPTITPTPSDTPTGTLSPSPTFTNTPTPTNTTAPVLGSIGNRVWHDANHNGVQDSGESGIEGVEINLIRSGVVLQTDFTSSTGQYLFSELEAGTYRLDVGEWSLPGGYVLVSGEEPWDVTLGAGEDRRDIDFGYALPATPTPSPTPVQDMQAYDFEVTQGIQNLPHWVRLVAGKRTFVRFYARTTTMGSAHATAVLRVQKGGAETWLLPLNPEGRINVNPYMPRSMLNGAFLFELPSGFRSGVVTLTGHVNPGFPLVPWSALPETNYSNNSITQTFTFESVPPLSVDIYRVGYQVSGISYMADRSHAEQLVSWLRRVYPVSEVQARHRILLFLGEASVNSDGKLTDPDCDRVNSALSPFVSDARAAALPGSIARVYGMVTDGGAFMRGCSSGIPSSRASGPAGTGTWGWDDDGSYGDWYGGHELGHTLGRLHAEFCGAKDGGFYPYSSGRIGPDTLSLLGRPFDRLYGFDIETREIYPDWWKDVMTYCDRQWISNYTYEGMMDYLQDHAVVKRLARGSGPTDRLLVAGSIDPDTQAVRLDPLFVLPDAKENNPRIPGDYAIVLRDDGGVELERYPFTPQELRSGPPNPDLPAEDEIFLLEISEMVPYVPGTDRVDIEGPGGVVLTTVTAGQGTPAIQITSPESGQTLSGDTLSVSWTASDPDDDPLTFLVQYSPDDGATWEMVALPTGENSIDIDAGNIVSGSQARFRVLASDGVHTTPAESEVFTVPNRVPTVEITTPNTGVTVALSQTLSLEAFAYDVDTGTMPDEQLEWRSDLDGVLSTGAQVSIANLSVGVHTITVDAKDGAGGTATDSVQVTVVATPDDLPPVEDALTAGPSIIGFDPGNAQTSETLYVGNQNGDSSLAWEASASDPWVQLEKPSGMTPDSISVSFNDPGLSLGIHTATITLTSPDLPGESLTIEVEAVIRDYLYLPVIVR